MDEIRERSGRLTRVLVVLCVIIAASFAPVSSKAAFTISDNAQRRAGVSRQINDAQKRLTVASSPITGPITIASDVVIDADWRLVGVKEIVLAGLIHNEASLEPAISITWTEDASGWFNLWRLQLETGQSAPIELATVTPRPGATYSTLLSYDPTDGDIAWQVIDDTGLRIISGGHRIRPVNGPLLAFSGALLDPAQISDVSVKAKSVTVYPEFLPVASRVQLLSVKDGQIAMVKYTRDDEALVRIQAPGGGASGTYALRFIDRDTGRVHEMGPLQLEGEESLLPLSISQLEPGQTTLEVTYYQNQQQWLKETLNLAIGSISTNYDRISFADGKAHTTVHIQADGPMENVPVEIIASVSKLNWNETRREYQVDEPSSIRLLSDHLTLSRSPFSVPVSFDLPKSATPGLWQVSLQVKSRLSIAMSEVATTHIFTNYSPPSSSDQSLPFTIAVLPDTQYYSRTYPDIFTRQTEWLAANAKDKNIRLALHLGDITDGNAHAEWVNAERSLSLLDGIVPYVLTVGNHDMASPGGIKDRTSTYFNQYFPASRYEHLPYFGGVFEAGRHENSFYTFTLGGVPYLVLALEFGPRDEVLDWANQVVQTHPSHQVIVITHTYTSSSGRRVTTSTTSAAPQAYPIGKDPSQSVNDGEQMWNKFVRKHANILMVLSGHIGVSTMRSQVSTGDHGNKVYEILADFQFEPNGGDGWLALLEFTDQQTIEVRTYSPYRGEYDDLRSAGGYTNRYYIDLKRGWLYKR